MPSPSTNRHNFTLSKAAVLTAAFDVANELEVIICAEPAGPDDRRWGHNNRGGAYGTGRLEAGKYFAWAQFKDTPFDAGQRPWRRCPGVC